MAEAQAELRDFGEARSRPAGAAHGQHVSRGRQNEQDGEDHAKQLMRVTELYDELVSNLTRDVGLKNEELKEARDLNGHLTRELCWWRDWYRSEYGTDSRTCFCVCDEFVE